MGVVALSCAVGLAHAATPPAETSQVEVLQSFSDRSDSSSPSLGKRVGGVVFFQAASLGAGIELWKTDGTENGTELVRDVNPGPEPSHPTPFAVMDGELYFFAQDGTHGRELWRSDGTPDGTVLVKDIRPGAAGAGPSYLSPNAFAVLDGVLYFMANDGTHGAELWRSDGTAEGTAMVRDLNPGEASSSPVGSDVAILDDAVLFSGNDGSSGTELWRSDGSEAGTQSVQDLNPGAGSSSPGTFLVAAGVLYLTASDPDRGKELWRSDGTSAGTRLVKDVNPGVKGSSIEELTFAGGRLYFSATDVLLHGRELWTSDGTPEGTRLVKDISTTGPGSSDPWRLTWFGDHLYFCATDQVHGYELWRTDGTEEGTVMVRDLLPGSGSSHAAPLGVLGDSMVLSAEGEVGQQLWRSDGTGDGTQAIADPDPEDEVASEIGSAAVLGGELLFAGNDGATGSELWRTDGQAAGTRLLKDLAPTGSRSLMDLTETGDHVTFSAVDGATGREIWKSNGTPGGTKLVRDVRPGPGSSDPDAFTELDGLTMFAAGDGVHGREIWASDGTADGTRLLKDVAAGAASSNPARFARADGVLYFVAGDLAHGRELWRTDGTQAGTALVADLVSGPTGSNPEHLTEFAGALYFATAAGLWRLNDPTSVPVLVIAKSNVWSVSESIPEELANPFTVVGDYFVFVTRSASIVTLWRSDGTTDGTVKLSDGGMLGLYPTWFGNTPIVVDGTLYFTAQRPIGSSYPWRLELWRSDGTPEGTVRVSIFGPEVYIGHFVEVSQVGGRVLVADSGVSDFGGEFTTGLMASDGTSDGTVMLRDIGYASGRMTPLGDWVYFVGQDSSHGYELWRTDGSPEGTGLFLDVEPGPRGSSLGEIVAVGSRLFFAGRLPSGQAALRVLETAPPGPDPDPDRPSGPPPPDGPSDAPPSKPAAPSTAPKSVSAPSGRGPRVTIGRTARLLDGRLAVRVSCRGTAPCQGVLRIRLNPARCKWPCGALVATSRFRVSAGTRKDLRLSVTAAGRERLRAATAPLRGHARVRLIGEVARFAPIELVGPARR